MSAKNRFILLLVLGAAAVFAVVAIRQRAGEKKQTPPERTKGAAETRQEVAEKQASPQPKDGPAQATQPGTKKSTQASNAVPADAPWKAVFSARYKPALFLKQCFQPIPPLAGDEATLKKWVAPVEGRPLQTTQLRTAAGGSAIRATGFARVTAPWFTANCGLRFSIENHAGLRFHVLGKRRGVTLVSYEDRADRWAAYSGRVVGRTKKGDSVVRPSPRQATNGGSAAVLDQLSLVASDLGRNRRTNARFAGKYALHYVGGEVVLARGDIAVLRVPLKERPIACYVEGAATWHALELVRFADQPRFPGASSAGLASPQRPSRESRSERVSQTSPAVFSLPGGFADIRIAVSQLSPGVELELRSDDEVVPVLWTAEHTITKQTCILTRSPRAPRMDTISRAMQTVVSDRTWLRVVVGTEQVRWWMGDGQVWAYGGAVQRQNVRPDKLVVKAVAKTAAATIDSMTVVRPSFGVSSPEDMSKARIAVAALKAAGLSAAEWDRRIQASRPPEVLPAQWTRACAVAAMWSGVESPRIAIMLRRAVQQNNAASLVQFAPYISSAQTQLLLDELRFASIRGALLDGKAVWDGFRHRAIYAEWPLERTRISIDQQQLYRRDLLSLLQQRRWQSTLHQVTRLKFFHCGAENAWLDWCLNVIRPNLPAGVQGQMPNRRNEWRHPLNITIDKATYNAVSELRGLLQSNAAPEAARLITTLPMEGDGLATNADDPDHFLSLPTYVPLLTRGNSAAVRQLAEAHGQLGRLRVATAAGRGDEQHVARLALQFSRTEAAAEAHRWLGARALATGRFERAVDEFAKSQSVAASAVKDEARALQRLAAAMDGKNLGEPITYAVRFGDRRLTASQFEQMVSEALAARRPAISVSPPARWENRTRIRLAPVAPLDGPVGENPLQQVTRRVNHFGVPWVDRQLAVVRQEHKLYVNNRFHVARFDLKSGEKVWQSAPAEEQLMNARSWTLIPMRPLLHEGRIYVRLLYDGGPNIVCISQETGAMIWRTRRVYERDHIGDPILVEGRLLTLTARRQQQQVVISVVTLDADTGETLAERELVRLRDNWDARRVCQWTAFPDGFVVSLGGVVLSASTAGDIRWLRRQTVLPPDEELAWVQQHYQAPLVVGQTVVVAQPGCRVIEVVDRITGALRWSRSFGDLRRVLGAPEDSLLVQDGPFIVCLDLATGRSRWTRKVGRLADAYHLGVGRLKVVQIDAFRNEDEPKVQRPIMFELDVATGRRKRSYPLAWQGDDFSLSHLQVWDTRQFAFHGTGTHATLRHLVKLTAAQD